MFIRAKTISGKRYAYLVRTRWDKKSKKVRQKVSRYLGPIITLDKIKDTGFFDYYNKYDSDDYINNVSIKQLVRDLVELELNNHGFSKKTAEIMTNGVLDVRIPYVPNVFSMNEGYLNRFTLKEIEKYDKILDTDDKRIPFKFAGLFVNAGLDIEKNLFVELYQRFFKDSI